MLLTAIEHRFLVEEFEFPMTETKLCAACCSMFLQFCMNMQSTPLWLLDRESVLGSTSLT
jgi:hypothetical protein